MGTKGIAEDLVDQAILSLASMIKMTPSVAGWSRKYLDEVKDTELQNLKTVSENRQRYLDSLEMKKSRAKDAFLDGIFNKEEYQTEIQKLKRLEAQERAKPLKVDWHSKLTDLTHLGDKIDKVWRRDNIKAKRAILADMSSNIHWDEKKLYFSTPKWLFAYINDLPSVHTEIQGFEQQKDLINQCDLEKLRDTFPSLCRMLENVRTNLIQSKDSFVKIVPLE